MLTWITIQAFQTMFAIRVQGDILGLLYFFGFVEILCEIGFFIIMTGLALYFKFIDKG